MNQAQINNQAPLIHTTPRNKSPLQSIIFFLTLIYLIIPKFNITQIGTLTSGLRIDDLIALILFITLFRHLLKTRDKGHIAFIFFLILATLSSILSILLFQNYTSILFSIRWLEYFVFFAVGVYFFKRDLPIIIALVTIFATQVVISSLQYLGIIGAITSSYGVVSQAERVMGTTGGPWELAPYISLISLVLFHRFITRKKAFVANLFFIAGFILVLYTSSRIGLAAYIISFVFLTISTNVRLLLHAIYALPIIFTTWLLFSEGVIERSAGLVDFDSNIMFLIDFYNQAEPFASIYITDISNTYGDLSWQIRAYKWAIAIKSFFSNTLFLLLGVGPGMWGSALDGGWIRLLTENGIIGLILFSSAFGFWARSPLLKAIILVMFLNMIFIDINYASKFMPLLFFIIGYFMKFKDTQSHPTIHQATPRSSR